MTTVLELFTLEYPFLTHFVSHHFSTTKVSQRYRSAWAQKLMEELG